MDDRPDPFAEYRQGRIPDERGDELAADLGGQWGKLAWYVVLIIALVVAAAWMVGQEFQWAGLFAEREKAVGEAVFYAGLIGWSLGWVVLRMRWLLIARRELANGTVVAADGELMWRRGEYRVYASRHKLRAVDGQLTELISGPYRFFLLPRSRVLVAAEWIGMEVPYYGLLRRPARANNFDLPLLGSHRSGRRGITLEWKVFPVFLIGCLAAVSYGAIPELVALWIGDIPNSLRGDDLVRDTASDALFSIATIIVIVVVAVIGVRWRSAPGAVRSITGRVRGEMGGDALVPAYRYVINGLAFTVSKEGYDALDDRLTYRLYYTARGRKLLNIEPVGEITIS